MRLPCPQEEQEEDQLALDLQAPNQSAAYSKSFFAVKSQIHTINCVAATVVVIAVAIVEGIFKVIFLESDLVRLLAMASVISDFLYHFA